MNCSAIIILVYLFLALVPKTTGNFEQVIMPELKISFEKTTVFLAALKDSQLIEAPKDLDLAEVIYEKLLVEEIKPEIQIVNLNGNGQHKVFTEGLTLSKKNILFVDAVDNYEKARELIASLPAAQANRLLASGNIHEIIDVDYSVQSVTDAAKEIIQQEIKNMKKEKPVETTLWNPLEQGIERANKYVQYKPRRRLAQTTTTHSSPSGSSSVELPPNYPAAEPEEVDYGGVGMVPSSIEKPEGDFTTASLATYQLSGKFSLVNGVAYVFGQHKLNIYHEVDNQSLGSAHINIANASFDLAVNSLEGDLVAEIRNLEGFRIAEARIPLTGLPKNLPRLDGFYLPLEPYYNGWYIETISAYSFDSYIQKEGDVYLDYASTGQARAKTNGDGHFQNHYITSGSSANFIFSGKGAWTTTKYIESGKKERAVVFDDSMVEALLATLRDQGMTQDAYSNGIVWGKIKTAHNSGKGVTVKVSDEGAFGPAYLDDLYIANKNLAFTTRNGYFIFVGVRPGLHTLEFSYNGKRFAKAIETAQANITYIELDLTTKLEQQLSIRKMDEEIEQEIESYIVGNSDTQVIASQPIKVASAKASTLNLFEFRLKRGEFVYRTHLPQVKKHLSLNILPEEKLLDYYKKNQWKNAVVAFVDRQNFSAVFVNQQNIEDNIVYFDSSGDIIPPHELNSKAVEVAGFIIPNLQPESHHIQIFNNDGSQKAHYIMQSDGLIYLLP